MKSYQRMAIFGVWNFLIKYLNSEKAERDTNTTSNEKYKISDKKLFCCDKHYIQGKL